MVKIHIIGAGLAGLAAGIKLASNGRSVTLYEAAPYAGGRCRSYYDSTLGRTIDNGNHLILGANTNALAYISLIGSGDRFITRKKPSYRFVDNISGDHFTFKPVWAMLALLKLLPARCSGTVLDCFNPASPLYRRFVESFCTAALNTDPKDASALLLRRTLWHILKKGRRGLRYYLARHSLAECLINPALKTIAAFGGEVHYNSTVKRFEYSGNKLSALICAHGSIDVRNDIVILAVPAHAATKLLPDILTPREYNAVINGHFLCPALPWPDDIDFLGVTGSLVQWIFYRDDIISTTTSAANLFAAQGEEALAATLWRDICTALQISRPLPPHRIICEKRATPAATPGDTIPPHIEYENLFLAGDYTDPSLPATIDSAVKSGFAAAEMALALSA